MKKVLVIAQTPPPYGGQAVMNKYVLDGNYTGANLIHLKMSFSKEINEVGKLSFNKLLELFRVVLKIYLLRITNRIEVLYYPPGGHSIVPIIRDLIILISTRWLFSKTVFHFHSGGFTEIYKKLPPVLRFFFKRAYFNPDVAIALSPILKSDLDFLNAKQIVIVQNGVNDFSKNNELKGVKFDKPSPTVLFVGVVSEAKGIFTLLGAINVLARKGIKFTTKVIGKFESKAVQEDITKYINENSLEEYIQFEGVLVGDVKHDAFRNADIFCLPTHADFEAFSLVLIEAMSFGLPVVTTIWRGLPDLVSDDCAFSVEIKNPVALAEKLQILINDIKLRRIMGLKARERYLELYTIEKFHKNMNAIFESLGD